MTIRFVRSDQSDLCTWYLRGEAGDRTGDLTAKNPPSKTMSLCLSSVAGSFTTMGTARAVAASASLAAAARFARSILGCSGSWEGREGKGGRGREEEGEEEK